MFNSLLFHFSVLSIEKKIILFSALAFCALLALFVLIGFAAVFKKAGQSPWKVLIPLYRWAVVLKIVEEKGVRLLLLFVPVWNVVYYYRLLVKLGKAFGKPASFAAGLFFLPFVFFLLLGFDSSVCLTRTEVETDDYWTYTRLR